MSDLEPMAVVRTLHIASTIAVAGALSFRLLLLPRFAPGRSGVAAARDAAAAFAARRASSWCATALVVAVASWLAWLGLTAGSMSGTPVARALEGDVLGIVLSRTTFGHVWIVRSACMVALVVCLLVARRDVRRRVTPAAGTAACLALALLVTIAGTGHAVAGEPSERFARISIDALHLLGAGAWLGTLLPLLFVLGAAARSPEPAWHALAATVVRRFSALGVLAVMLLLGSGLANAVSLVGTWSALADTPYGRLLGAKVALFALILAVAAVNRLHWTPRLETPAAHDRALRTLRRNAIAELVIGVAVVGLVGALGVTAPPAHANMGAMQSTR